MSETGYEGIVLHGVSCSCCTPVFADPGVSNPDPNAHNPVPDQGYQPADPAQVAPVDPMQIDPNAHNPLPDQGIRPVTSDPAVDGSASGTGQASGAENLVWVAPGGERQVVGVAAPDGQGDYVVTVPLQGGGTAIAADTNLTGVADVLVINGPDGRTVVLRDANETGDWRPDDSVTGGNAVTDPTGGSAGADPTGGGAVTDPTGGSAGADPTGGGAVTHPGTVTAPDPATGAGSGSGIGADGLPSEVPPAQYTGDPIQDMFVTGDHQSMVIAEQYWHVLHPGQPLPRTPGGQLETAQSIFYDLLPAAPNQQIHDMIQHNIDMIEQNLHEIVALGSGDTQSSDGPTGVAQPAGVQPSGGSGSVLADPTVAGGPHLVLQDPNDPAPWVENHGEGTTAARVWEPQSADGLCADNSVKMVIESLTGVHLTEAQVESVAVSLGIQTMNADGTVSGIAPDGVEPLIEALGLDAGTYAGLDMVNLQHLLDQGVRPIVGVDSQLIWAGNPGEGVDHAVEVTDIYTDASGATWVMLNDPGQPHGAGYTIPWNLFAESWHEAGNMAIIATASAEQTVDVAKAAELPDPVDAYAGVGLPDPVKGGASAGLPEVTAGPFTIDPVADRIHDIGDVTLPGGTHINVLDPDTRRRLADAVVPVGVAIAVIPMVLRKTKQ